MSKEKKERTKNQKICFILSFIAVMTISLSGMFMLIVENKDKAHIIEPETDVTYTDTNDVEANDSKLVNINTASVEELMLIDSIGDKRAEDIVNYRKTKKFEVKEDIMNVSGIGKKIYEKIEDKICVE